MSKDVKDIITFIIAALLVAFAPEVLEFLGAAGVVAAL